jgi:hypothetical protein
MHVFQMISRSPKHVQFPEVVFLHKRGIIQ